MLVWMEAYGCTMNQGEGRDMLDRLLCEGHESALSPQAADAVVMVTCNVIESTERRMLGRMREIRGNGKTLVVAGCMAASRRPIVKSTAPGAIMLRPRELHRVGELLPGAAGSCPPQPSGPDAAFEDRVDAIVPVGQGCLNACTYCITRVARGTMSSYPLEDLVSQVEREVARGAREILLTGQDTAAYGHESGHTLAGLVDAVARVPGEFMIRVGMASPFTVMPILHELLHAYRHPKVYRFLHLPVQSGSNRILDAMRREYTVEDFLTIVEAYRQRFPRGSLSTDFIVGFPGEADEDHARSVELLERVRPDVVNVTRFSRRPGTPAHGFPDQVVGWRTKERSREMTRVRQRVAMERNETWIGLQVTATTTEKGKPGTTMARTHEYKPVVLVSDLPLGRVVEVDVTGATESYLVGRTQ